MSPPFLSPPPSLLRMRMEKNGKGSGNETNCALCRLSRWVYIAIYIIIIYIYIYVCHASDPAKGPFFRGDTQITTDAIFSPRRRSNTRGSSAKQKYFPYPVGRMASTSFPSTKYVMTSFCFSFKLAIPMVV